MSRGLIGLDVAAVRHSLGLSGAAQLGRSERTCSSPLSYDPLHDRAAALRFAPPHDLLPQPLCCCGRSKLVSRPSLAVACLHGYAIDMRWNAA